MSEVENPSIVYPRRVKRRSLLKIVGRIATRLLARPRIIGRENFPEHGPLILVGNHSAFLEVMLMAVYSPFRYSTEMMGAGDIPLDPRYAWMADIYGMIPVKRGQMDRASLNKALDVLAQGGVIGLFPEGGNWETGLREARHGVAWLSQKSQAPIVPIGFGGMESAISDALKLKLPRITMSVGEMIPAVPQKSETLSRKELLAEGANRIMDAITALVPEEERRLQEQDYIGESYDLEVTITSPDGTPFTLPEDVAIVEQKALAKFFHRPVMLDVFLRNLKMPVKVLTKVNQFNDPAELAAALNLIVAYLEENPYFFHYRFGNEEGGSMTRSIRQFRDAMDWLAKHKPGYEVQIKPVRRYFLKDSNEEVVVDTPPLVHEI